MSVVSRGTRKKSWQTIGEVVNLLDALAEKETEIASRLEELRKAHGLSQEAAAHEVGVSTRQWQRWEAGESEPRGRSLARIADGLDTSIAELVGHSRGSQLDRVEEQLTEIHRLLVDALERVPSEEGKQRVAGASDRLLKAAGSPLRKAGGRPASPPAERRRRTASP